MRLRGALRQVARGRGCPILLPERLFQRQQKPTRSAREFLARRRCLLLLSASTFREAGE